MTSETDNSGRIVLPSENGEPGDIADEKIDAQVKASAFAVSAMPVLIGRYRVLRHLGHGGTGVVYSAYDPELDRKVAIKIVRSSPVGDRTRALREGKALAMFSHPNVVAVYDVGERDDDVWIAMEFVSGQTLRAWAKQSPRSWREVRRVLTDAARGVAAAHAAGLIHRDLKPDNVMINREGRVQVLDFGLADLDASVTERSTQTLPHQTKSGVTRGTPAYMAPEQWEGDEVGPAADQFGWSVMAWELLFGERPFADAAAIRAGRRQPRPKRTTVPGWLIRVVERGLAHALSDRHANMQALIGALESDPTRRRRAVVAATLGAVGLGVWLGGLQIQHRGALAACDAAGGIVDTFWSEEARRDVRDGLLSTGTSFAAATIDTILPRLDAYAEQWRQTRVDVCRVSTVERAWAPEIAEQAQSCLDERLQQLRSTWTILASAGPDDVGRGLVVNAVRMVTRLPDLSACVDVAGLAVRPRVPEDEAAREEIQRVRGMLAEASAVHTAGLFDRALERADAAQSAADATGWPPVQAEALAMRGNALDSLGDYAAAEAALEDAYFRAGAIGYDELAAKVAMDLAGVVGVRIQRHAEGLRWGKAAEMALNRHGVPADDPRRIPILGTIGLVHDRLGDPAAAVAVMTTALAIGEAAVEPDLLDVANTLQNLSDSQRKIAKHSEAIEASERALGIYEELLGPYHPLVGTSLNTLGILHASLGAYNQALDLLERAREVEERAIGPDHPAMAITLGNLGNLHRIMGHTDRAIELLTRVYELSATSLGAEHPQTIQTMSLLGTLYCDKGEYASANDLLTRALEATERTRGADHLDVAIRLTNLGILYRRQGRRDEAKAAFERVLRIQEQRQGTEFPALGETLHQLARFYAQDGRDEQAIRLLERALKVLEPDQDPFRATCLATLASIHRQRKELVLAASESRHAVELAEAAWGPADASLAYVLMIHGSILLDQGSLPQARATLERAAAIEASSVELEATRAEARFALARALWLDLTARPRALELARATRDGSRGAEARRIADEIGVWLQQRGG